MILIPYDLLVKVYCVSIVYHTLPGLAGAHGSVEGKLLWGASQLKEEHVEAMEVQLNSGVFQQQVVIRGNPQPAAIIYIYIYIGLVSSLSLPLALRSSYALFNFILPVGLNAHWGCWSKQLLGFATISYHKTMKNSLALRVYHFPSSFPVCSVFFFAWLTVIQVTHGQQSLWRGNLRHSCRRRETEETRKQTQGANF